jgi:integrase/recombinase XerD
MRWPVQRAIGRWEAQAGEYLAFRRDLGFALRRAVPSSCFLHGTWTRSATMGLSPRKLPCTGLGAPCARPEYGAWRLEAVRGFAKYLAATDARHEVPPIRVLGRTYRRAQPHIYSSEEIVALLDAALTIKPIDALPPQTFRTFFGLLAATGLRCGEALGLHRDHVDLTQGRLTIVKGKPGRARVVPMHASVVGELAAYAKLRDSSFPRGKKSEAFFLSRRATALAYQRVTVTFRQLRRQLGWRTDPLPRVHDLRHTFAVRTLLRWCEAGTDVDRKILALTTYLSHVNVTSTYWYFSAVPELMAITGRRFEPFARREGAP